MNTLFRIYSTTEIISLSSTTDDVPLIDHSSHHWTVWPKFALIPPPVLTAWSHLNSVRMQSAEIDALNTPNTSRPMKSAATLITVPTARGSMMGYTVKWSWLIVHLQSFPKVISSGTPHHSCELPLFCWTHLEDSLNPSLHPHLACIQLKV